jgi:hypothetical protein
VDAPAPIRHENLTSAQDCLGFWIRANEPRRHEHGAVIPVVILPDVSHFAFRQDPSGFKADLPEFLGNLDRGRKFCTLRIVKSELAAYPVTTVALCCYAGIVQQHWQGRNSPA